ncbi:probable RNA-directed DNA polymerase from transposon BS [Trichonephila clavipes]|nr:probable RNA-directed DNA polymerase from transposon BS [Trichonephila clavipes]
MSKIKDDPQKMWKRRIIDMELNYHARPIQKNVGLSRKKKIEKSYQRLYLGSPRSFKAWKMLIYVVKSSFRSFCRAWDRVIIDRDDSDRLVRNLRRTYHYTSITHTFAKSRSSSKIECLHEKKKSRLPAEWKRATIIPIKKAGKNNWAPKDFRPVALTGNTLAWISDFLHHRSNRVNFNNTFSDPVVLGQGVPQGSVLSPTLFSLYLAGIEKTPSVEMRVGLFADDIVIWCSGRDLVAMERNLNNALSSFSDYALKFKLCFNPTKSIATFFTTNKRLYSYQPTLKMDNKNLAYEKHPKYLGYVLDPEWSSHKHIDHIVSKCRKRLGILKFIAGKDWGAEAVSLRDTYLALIRPILEYGFPVYCCASAASLEKLEKIQLGAARIITGLRRSCPKEIVLFEADLQPLHLRSKNILTNYFNKLSSYGHHNKTSLYFNN